MPKTGTAGTHGVLNGRSMTDAAAGIWTRAADLEKFPTVAVRSERQLEDAVRDDLDLALWVNTRHRVQSCPSRPNDELADAARVIRQMADETKAGVPIIALTGNTVKQEIARCLDAPA